MKTTRSGGVSKGMSPLLGAGTRAEAKGTKRTESASEFSSLLGGMMSDKLSEPPRPPAAPPWPAAPSPKHAGDIAREEPRETPQTDVPVAERSGRQKRSLPEAARLAEPAQGWRGVPAAAPVALAAGGGLPKVEAPAISPPVIPADPGVRRGDEQAKEGKPGQGPRGKGALHEGQSLQGVVWEATEPGRGGRAEGGNRVNAPARHAMESRAPGSENEATPVKAVALAAVAKKEARIALPVPRTGAAASGGEGVTGSGPGSMPPGSLRVENRNAAPTTPSAPETRGPRGDSPLAHGREAIATPRAEPAPVAEPVSVARAVVAPVTAIAARGAVLPPRENQVIAPPLVTAAGAGPHELATRNAVLPPVLEQASAGSLPIVGEKGKELAPRMSAPAPSRGESAQEMGSLRPAAGVVEEPESSPATPPKEPLIMVAPSALPTKKADEAQADSGHDEGRWPRADSRPGREKLAPEAVALPATTAVRAAPQLPWSGIAAFGEPAPQRPSIDSRLSDPGRIAAPPSGKPPSLTIGETPPPPQDHKASFSSPGMMHQERSTLPGAAPDTGPHEERPRMSNRGRDLPVPQSSGGGRQPIQPQEASVRRGDAAQVGAANVSPSAPPPSQFAASIPATATVFSPPRSQPGHRTDPPGDRAPTSADASAGPPPLTTKMNTTSDPQHPTQVPSPGRDQPDPAPSRHRIVVPVSARPPRAGLLPPAGSLPITAVDPRLIAPETARPLPPKPSDPSVLPVTLPHTTGSAPPAVGPEAPVMPVARPNRLVNNPTALTSVAPHAAPSLPGFGAARSPAAAPVASASSPLSAAVPSSPAGSPGSPPTATDQAHPLAPSGAPARGQGPSSPPAERPRSAGTTEGQPAVGNPSLHPGLPTHVGALATAPVPAFLAPSAPFVSASERSSDADLDALASDVGAQISLTANSAEITIDRGGEGEMALFLKVKDSGLDMRVEGAGSHVLGAHLPELKSALAQEGILLSSVSVALDQRSPDGSGRPAPEVLEPATEASGTPRASTGHAVATESTAPFTKKRGVHVTA